MVDGKAIAAAIIADTRARVGVLRAFGVPTLAIITCAPDFATRKYLDLKQRKAAAAGVAVVVEELPETATTAEVVAAIAAAALTCPGVVVQLPLPRHVDREAVLAAVPVTHDPDGFWYGRNPEALPSPVVVAVAEIATQHGLVFKGKKVVVLGNGRLVGQPITSFLRAEGAEVVVVTAESAGGPEALAAADIIVSGVGKPHLITADMVQEGVVVFDAGTSEDGGVLAGDMHPLVASKAALFTPVPGGIGPVTVAALLANTVTLAERQWQSRG